MKTAEFLVQRAGLSDLEILISFTTDEYHEAEICTQVSEGIAHGIKTALQDDSILFGQRTGEKD